MYAVRSAVLLVAVLLLAGCENRLDPVVGDAGFTIHGFVNVSAERQFVRVRDMNSPLTPEATRTLEATVFLEEVATGDRIRLRDSVVVFQDVYTHNFRGRMDVRPDAEYRVVVEGPDGATTTATARTPKLTAVDRVPASGHCLTPFVIWFRDVTEINLLRASVGFKAKGQTFWFEQQPRFGPTESGETEVHVNFQAEEILANEIESQDDPGTRFLLEPRCWALNDNRILIAYTHLGPAWSGRVAEAEYDPTESVFVEDGLGFFGGLRQDTVSVVVDTSDVIEGTP